MKTSAKNQVTPERLMQFGFAYAPPLVIGAAVSNKVFDSLAGGAKSVEQLSKETGASVRGLRSIMNALVGLELLKKDRHENFSLTPESDLLEADFGSGYDIATLGHILHSEGEERSRNLLKKTFRALKSGGSIAIGEWLVNDQRTEPLPSLMFAVNMLVNTEHGDTFSFNEIKSWLEEARFKKVRKLGAPGPSPLILATKR
jgi:hypothetical protein